jgi:hypothetical protein
MTGAEAVVVILLQQAGVQKVFAEKSLGTDWNRQKSSVAERSDPEREPREIKGGHSKEQ